MGEILSKDTVTLLKSEDIKQAVRSIVQGPRDDVVLVSIPGSTDERTPAQEVKVRIAST